MKAFAFHLLRVVFSTISVFQEMIYHWITFGRKF